MTTSPATRPDHLELSARSIVSLYTALRLRANGLHATDVDPVAALNRQTGRGYTAATWLRILAPYYQAITQP